MNPQRRTWLALLGAVSLPARAASDDGIRRGRALAFPRDHGAHPASRTEWWYATGWLRAGDAAQSLLGFQLTFFRSRTDLAPGHPSRFAAHQLLFAHAALTDPASQSHLHAERIARWSGTDDRQLRARAALQDTDIALDGWLLRRDAGNGSYRSHIAATDFELELHLKPTQPLLLQGDAGFSRKGPDEVQASHYYSLPQLEVQARVARNGKAVAAVGRAWLDHEWSESLLHPQAVGWDWIGINLDDGRALTAFRLRRADGSALWAGGSLRAPGGPLQVFAPDAVRFEPGRRWRSPGSNAQYPVEWQVETPAGRFGVRSLMDAQELDSRGSTGSVYWEGLSELLDAGGRRIGLGYLEMTGYAGTLKL